MTDITGLTATVTPTAVKATHQGRQAVADHRRRPGHRLRPLRRRPQVRLVRDHAGHQQRRPDHRLRRALHDAGGHLDLGHRGGHGHLHDPAQLPRAAADPGAVRDLRRDRRAHPHQGLGDLARPRARHGRRPPRGPADGRRARRTPRWTRGPRPARSSSSTRAATPSRPRDTSTYGRAAGARGRQRAPASRLPITKQATVDGHPDVGRPGLRRSASRSRAAPGRSSTAAATARSPSPCRGRTAT